MKYILFEKSAVEHFVSQRGYQSIEFYEGCQMVHYILEHHDDATFFKSGVIKKTETGIMFVGSERTKSILVIDLAQCELLEMEKDNPDNLLFVLQRMFRAAIRIWYRQPFTGAERVNKSKLVLFPFQYNINKKNNKRLVIEREVNAHRLSARGIIHPLLVYKYNDAEIISGSDETPDVSVISKAGEAYLENWATFTQPETLSAGGQAEHPLGNVRMQQPVSGDGGFKFLSFDKQYESLTSKQKEVVDYSSSKRAIRIVGPAGTGKTTSMILRAYKLLRDSRESNQRAQMIFITHSESTRFEAEAAFCQLENAQTYLRRDGNQSIEFITLLAFCKRYRKIADIQTIDHDAAEAKEYQLMMIEEAYKSVKESEYKAYEKYLSNELKGVLKTETDNVLMSLLQHEFSIQIKGRADGSIDKYKEISSIKNALPVSRETRYKDKDFVFAIYRQYEQALKSLAIYDTDDIIIEALMSLNAPIWRRERADYGYDYIFVDEIHLFNLNEQHLFHFLTRDASKTSIPICFALDYSQAIGDRGDLSDSFIERELSPNAEEFKYETVMRNSLKITNFCMSLIESGVLLFQTGFLDPYTQTQAASTLEEENTAYMPQLIMANNEQDMCLALKHVIDDICKSLQCKNYQIAIISFDDQYLEEESIDMLEKVTGRSVYYLAGRNIGGLSKAAREKNAIILTSPYNINGLEFNAVILLGVDGARVPQSIGVNDISKNYLRYTAYNMLYLSCSRAKDRIVILGNKQNGQSECLDHSIGDGTLEVQ